MTLITVNLSYYNQPKSIVLKHLNYWKKFNTNTLKYFTFIIIDDGSRVPIDKMLSNEDIEGCDVRLLRVIKDMYCNIGGIRNLGAQQCKTPWYIFIDMDTLINAQMADSLVELAQQHMQTNNVFKFNRKVINNKNHIKHNQMHPAVCLLRIEDYWNIGGCDEDFVGHYGYTDPHFWFRASGKVKLVECRDIYLEYDDDGESEITRDTKHNRELFETKKQTSTWSTDYVRFEWKEIHLT